MEIERFAMIILIGVLSMQVGDLVKHRRTGFIAIVLKLPQPAFASAMVKVITSEGIGLWRQAKCEVISDSR